MVGLNEVFGVLLPLMIGYFIALAIYMGTTFTVAQFFRSGMVAEGRALPGFYAASAMAWILATFAACAYVMTQAPYWWEIIPMALAILFVLLRDAREFSMQQPRGLVALCGVAIVASACAVWLVWKP